MLIACIDKIYVQFFGCESSKISRTLLFHTHFSQIRYQIKANTPTHMAKQTKLFLFSIFEVGHFFTYEAKLLGQVYFDVQAAYFIVIQLSMTLCFIELQRNMSYPF